LNKLIEMGKRRAEDMWNRSREIISKHVDPNGKILDVGVGFGQITEVFMDNLKGGFKNVFSIDVIRLLQVKKLKENYALAKGEYMPYASESVKTVFITDVLHHTPKPEDILAESSRVLEAEGIVVVLENLLRDDLPEPLKTIYRKILFAFDNTSNAQNEVDHPHSNQTLAGWQKLAELSGLEMIDHKEWQWGLVDFIPGLAEKGNRDKPGILRPFTDSVMVFRKSNN